MKAKLPWTKSLNNAWLTIYELFTTQPYRNHEADESKPKPTHSFQNA